MNHVSQQHELNNRTVPLSSTYDRRGLFLPVLAVFFAPCCPCLPWFPLDSLKFWRSVKQIKELFNKQV